MDEIWKPIVSYEDYYMVSNKGRIFSKISNKILKLTCNKNGYLHFSACSGGKSKIKTLKVHRIVAETFLESPEQELLEWANNSFYKKVLVNHKDGNKSNNCVENLEWVNSSINTKHSFNIGQRKYLEGVLNHCSKLTIQDVHFIRNNYRPYCREFGSRALSKKYNISHSKILDVVNNKSYKE